MSGLVRFWSEHRELCEAVLEQAAVPRLCVDVSARRWHEATREALSFFQLDVADCRPTQVELARFAGTYALDEMTGANLPSSRLPVRPPTQAEPRRGGEKTRVGAGSLDH